MKFAINYSPQAEALARAGKIIIDLYKCPDWHDLVSTAEAHLPVYIHFPVVLGRGAVKSLDFDAIEGWLKRTKTRFVNSHLEVLRKYFPENVTGEQVLDAVVPELELLIRRFGAERVIMENVPYSDHMIPRGLLPIAVNAGVIRTAVETAGCGFLLDISHAALSCERTGEKLEEYLEKLPVHKLRELHVTGIATGKDGLRGDHMPMDDPDWQRLERVIERIHSGAWSQPEVMAFEYGGIGEMFEWRSESGVIEAQVPRLYALAHRYDTLTQEA